MLKALGRHALVLALVVILVGCTASAPPPATVTPARAAAVPPTVRRTRVPDPTETVGPTPTVAQLTHGPVVGAVTDSSARVFVRTNRSARVSVRYGTDPQLRNAQASTAGTTGDASDWTAQIELTGLQPAATYYLDVLADGASQLDAPYPQFKTFPPPGTAAPFRFVVLTDFRSVRKNQRDYGTFRAVANEQPAFVIIGGDFDHSNPRTVERKELMFKGLYTAANHYEDFVNLILRRFPVAHMWDDHDYFRNNADKRYPDKPLALEMLQRYFPVYPVSRHGDWQTFTYGNAQFFLLDSRSQRDPASEPDGPDKSMLDGDNLGEAGQWAWLTNGLKNSTATWKFIVTPVVFNATMPKADAWHGYLFERTRLVKFIRENNISGVIFLSGDVHAGALDDGTYADFPEMVVPSVNMQSCLTATRPGDWSAGVYAGPRNEPCPGYGVVSVETNPDRVVLEVKDGNGEPRLKETISE